MFGINLFNYLDRYVAASVAPMVKRELNLTDSEIGLFGTAFLLVYAIAAVPFGYWGDRGIRKNVIAIGVAIWSVATFFTGFARTYWQLFLSRAVVGIGEAGYYPAGTSLMSDYFPKEQRSRVMSIWGAGSTVGIALGFAGGGFLASDGPAEAVRSELDQRRAPGGWRDRGRRAHRHSGGRLDRRPACPQDADGPPRGGHRRLSCRRGAGGDRHHEPPQHRADPGLCADVPARGDLGLPLRRAVHGALPERGLTGPARQRGHCPALHLPCFRRLPSPVRRRPAL